jgi:hypothetical protein
MLIWMALASAFAAMVPHEHEVPETLTLFERVRYVTASGKSKEGCDDALKLAQLDLRNSLKGRHAEEVVAIWPYKGRSGWDTVDEVFCLQKGKKAVVELEALINRPGKGPEYPELSRERWFQMVEIIYGRGAIGLTTMDRIGMEEGLLVHRKALTIYMARSLNRRPEQQVLELAIKERFIPALHRQAKVLKKAPELQGVWLWTSVNTEVEERKIRHEAAIVIPRKVLMAYHRGQIGEKAVFQKSTMFYAAPGQELQKAAAVPLHTIRNRSDSR